MKLNKFMLCLINFTLLISVVKGQTNTPTITDFFNMIKSESDTNLKEASLIKMESMEPTGSSNELLTAARQYVAISFAEHGNGDKAVYWMEKIQDPEWKEMTIAAIARELIDGNHLDKAQLILKPYLTKSDKKKTYEYQYGKLLFMQGKYKDANEYLSPSNYLNPAAAGIDSRLYVQVLIKSGKLDQAIAEFRKFDPRPGMLTPQFRQEVKNAFVTKYGDDKSFKVYIDSLDAAQQRKMDEKVQKMVVNTPAPNFELTDLNGNKVSLAGLKGKTVVLDFWATWCIPCVESFPAMQKAVDYYKNDKSVVFLFIHSYERNTGAVEEAKKLIASKKYTFDVFMDMKTSGKRSPVATSFGVTGLPTKLIIDKNGIVKIRNVGFLAEEEGIPEVSAMVEAARK